MGLSLCLLDLLAECSPPQFFWLHTCLYLHPAPLVQPRGKLNLMQISSPVAVWLAWSDAACPSCDYISIWWRGSHALAWGPCVHCPLVLVKNIKRRYLPCTCPNVMFILACLLPEAAIILHASFMGVTFKGHT